MDYKRVNNDINGNPRYVFHFLNFLNDGEKHPGTDKNIWWVTDLYQLALKKAREIGGKKYRGKDFGGGIVIQSYNIQDTIRQIKELQQKTTVL